MGHYVAKPFVAGSPNAEVTGQAMIAFLENMEVETIAHILEDMGLTDIDPDKWYPHQVWMDVLKQMDETLEGGASQAFVAFGRQVANTAVMPPELDSVPAVLNALHAIHHANLRGVPQEEGYAVEQLGEQHYYVYENTPNPSDAIYGFIWGLVARFKGENDLFVVRPIDNPKPDEQPGTCFEVKWGRTEADIS